ncbi:MAG: hypothetical protein IKC20_01410 [Clostridia bacterium]|nr:hypothetical protein [Clostridia bacterium]
MKKIKGSLSKPEPFAIITAAAISLCVLLPLRVYQVTQLIDPETGFFTENNFTVPLFYILCAVVVAGVAAFSFLSEKAGRTRNVVGRSIPTGVAAGLTALAVMFDSVYRVYTFIEMNAAYVESVDFTRMQYLSKSGATALLLQAVFGVLTAFFLGFTPFPASAKQQSSAASPFFPLPPLRGQYAELLCVLCAK